MALRHYWHRIVYAGVVMLMVVIPNGHAANPPKEKPLTLGDILEGIRTRRARLDGYSATLWIKNYHRQINGRWQAPMVPTPLRWQVKRSGHRVRVARDMGEKRSYDFAWNGARLTTLLTDNNLPEAQRFSGTIQSKPHRGSFQACEFLTPLEEWIFDYDQPLSELTNAGKWRLVGTEVIAGRNSWHIQGSAVGNRLHPTLDVWVDASEDFVPVRFLVTATLQQKVFQEGLDDVQTANVNGTWVIRHAQGWVKNPMTIPGQIQIYDYDIADVRVGQTFKDDTFAIQFPPGTMVWDDIAKVGSKVRDLRVSWTPAHWSEGQFASSNETR